MTHQRGNHAQVFGSLRPQGFEAECLRRKNDRLWWLSGFVLLVCAARYAKFFGGSLLFPAHACSPQLQFVASHTDSSSFTLIHVKAQKLRTSLVFHREYNAKPALVREFWLTGRAIGLRFLRRGAVWLRN